MKSRFRRKAEQHGLTIMMLLFIFGFMCIAWGAANKIGQSIAPSVREHEMEHAYCYTAGKMFFVSIACVPKV